MAANSRNVCKSFASIKQQIYEDIKHDYEDDGEGFEHDYEVDGEGFEHDYDDDKESTNDCNENLDDDMWWP